ncbi:hypothetical protein [Rhodopirellula bahusiensis]|uniref:hypothetical protein n=1 Tax=Rhodopirellula bahusiensis TaxID=2014065 RepID=UPI003264EDE9
MWEATGATLAGVVMGGLLSLEAAQVSGEVFLYGAVALDLMTISVIRFLPRTSSVRASAARTSSPPRLNLPDPKESLVDRYQRVRHYRWALGALMAAQVVALTFMGYQWNVIVTEYHLGNEEHIIAYFAAFYAINDAIILLLQVSAAGKLLDRLGIGWVLLLYPLSLLAVALAMLASPQIAYLFIIVTLVWILVLTPWLVFALLVVSIHHTGRPDAVAMATDDSMPASSLARSA